VVESKLDFEDKRHAIKRLQSAAAYEHAERKSRMDQFLDRTAALDRAKAKAMRMRVEQARRIGLQARSMNEAQKTRRAEAERKQYAELARHGFYGHVVGR
jgi:hypothetical protein